MAEQDIEKIRDNLDKKNLKSFLEGLTDEARKRMGGHFTPDFLEGVNFTIGAIRNFFKIQ